MPRKIKVVTVSMPPKQKSFQENRRRSLDLLDAAGAQQPDLICLPESVPHIGMGRGEWPVGVESVPGPYVEALAARARRYNCYVVAGMYAYHENSHTAGNAALLIDRTGAVVGRYDKVHPTIPEVEAGVLPGRRSPVFETDFGVLGLAICYDIGWPDHWRALADQGAELVVWPSAYDGGFPLCVYAWTHFYYVVSSVWGDHSKVIDITGKVLASTSHWSRLVTAQIDLDKEVFHIDNQVETLLRVQAEMGDSVTATAFSEENIFTLESNDPQWPLARIKERYSLENYRDYHARATQVQDRAVHGLLGERQLP